MFYDNFVRLCNSVNKSPSAVALDIGVAKSTVSRWKTGSAPNYATVIKLAEYFGVYPAELTDKKMTLVDRIYFLLSKRQVPVSYMEAKLNFEPGYIDGLGDDIPPEEALERIADYLGCSVDFLLHGMDKKNKPDTTSGAELNPNYLNLNEENKKFIDDLIAKLLKSQSAD